MYCFVIYFGVNNCKSGVEMTKDKAKGYIIKEREGPKEKLCFLTKVAREQNLMDSDGAFKRFYPICLF